MHAEQCQYISMSNMSSSERTHYSKVYGINRLTILLNLPEFDVTKQLPQDIMHVLLEGIFPLHMERLLDYIINHASLLTLDQINSRISEFPYAYFNEKPSRLSGICLQGNQSGTEINLLSLFRCGNC